MTTGSRSTGSLVPNSPITYTQTYPPPDSVVTTYSVMGETVSKVWSGGNKPLLVNPARDKRIKRTYVVPVEVRYRKRNGSYGTKTILEKRVFFERAPRKRDTRLPPNNYSVTFEKVSKPSGSYVRKLSYKSGTLFSSTNITGPYSSSVNAASLVAPLVWGANDDIKLVSKLRERIRGSDFNLSVFLAEGRQSLGMIASSASRLAAALWYTRKGDPRKAAEILFHDRPVRKRVLTRRQRSANSVSNNWLELSYGWLPLLEDMKSSAEQLAHRLETPFRQRYSVRTQIGTSLPGSYGMPEDSAGFSNRTTSIKTQLIVYVEEQESLVTLAGLQDPELVLWELLPFSFVGDWVIPIGQYLEARAFASKLKVSSVIRTTIKREVVSGFVGNINPNTNPSYFDVRVTGSTGGGYERTAINRVVSSSLSVPKPQLKQLGEIAAWQRAANAVALIGQALTSRRRPSF